MYITLNEQGSIVIYLDEPVDIPFLKVDSLPEGEGMLRTDLKTVWREPYPKFEAPIETKLKAQQDRTDFLEDCIAEMAQIIYS